MQYELDTKQGILDSLLAPKMGMQEYVEGEPSLIELAGRTLPRLDDFAGDLFVFVQSSAFTWDDLSIPRRTVDFAKRVYWITESTKGYCASWEASPEKSSVGIRVPSGKKANPEEMVLHLRNVFRQMGEPCDVSIQDGQLTFKGSLTARNEPRGVVIGPLVPSTRGLDMIPFVQGEFALKDEGRFSCYEFSSLASYYRFRQELHDSPDPDGEWHVQIYGSPLFGPTSLRSRIEDIAQLARDSQQDSIVIPVCSFWPGKRGATSDFKHGVHCAAIVDQQGGIVYRIVGWGKTKDTFIATIEKTLGTSIAWEHKNDGH